MSDTQRSFWSTTAGVFTGVAGVITASVGLLGASVQLGWIGSKDKTTTTTTTAAPAAAAGGGSTVPGPATTTTAATGRLSVAPAKVTFQLLGDRDQSVTVSNTGTAALALLAPFVDGPDKSQFSATGCDSSSRLDPGRSCDVKVTYLASKSGKATARLVIAPMEGGPAQEVPLEAGALLG